MNAYLLAQEGMSKLRAAIHILLAEAGQHGLKEGEIGHRLGIHAETSAHRGQIPQTLLALMEIEGVVERDPTTAKWRLRQTFSE